MTTTLTDNLRCARIACDQARETLDQEIVHETAAREHSVACEREVARRAEARSAWIERQSRRTESEILAGKTPHTAPAADVKAQLEDASALANSEAALQVLARRQSATAAAREVLGVAEAAVTAAVDAILETRALGILAEIERAEREIKVRIDDLRAYVASGAMRPLACQEQLRQMIDRAEAAAAASVDWMHTPVSVLRGETSAQMMPVSRLAEMRAELIEHGGAVCEGGEAVQAA
jgi:hypothetical protein